MNNNWMCDKAQVAYEMAYSARLLGDVEDLEAANHCPDCERAVTEGHNDGEADKARSASKPAPKQSSNAELLAELQAKMRNDAAGFYAPVSQGLVEFIVVSHIDKNNKFNLSFSSLCKLINIEPLKRSLFRYSRGGVFWLAWTQRCR